MSDLSSLAINLSRGRHRIGACLVEECQTLVAGNDSALVSTTPEAHNQSSECRRLLKGAEVIQPTAHSPGVGALAALEGAALIVWNLVATPFIGRRRLGWGTVATETTDSLPGDELVPEPKWSYTLGIAIDASAEAVWPWIAQIGQGRGGFYTYQTLENIAGCRITNTTEILPDQQHPEVGGDIYLHPTAPPLRIERADPPDALVLFGSPADIGEGVSTWQFVINPGPDGSSRLLTRGRYDHTADWKSRLAFGRFPIEAITFVMSRKMMLEIKRLAERDA